MTQTQSNVSKSKNLENSSKWEWEIKLTTKNQYKNFDLSLQKCGDTDILENIDDADYIIIPENNIYIRFDYPLNNPIGKRFHHAGGFSRKILVNCIYQVYRELSAQSLLVGHTLEELMLVGVEFDPATKMVSLIVES